MRVGAVAPRDGDEDARCRAAGGRRMQAGAVAIRVGTDAGDTYASRLTDTPKAAQGAK